MEKNGWRCLRENARDDFAVRNGELTALCSPSPYEGATYGRTVAVPARGELTFEVKTFLDGYNQSMRHFMKIGFGPLTLAFVRDGLARHLETSLPNWKTVATGRVPFAHWTPVKVAWDRRTRTLSYFVGSGAAPTTVEDDVDIFGEEKAVSLTVGNYGLSRAFERHALRNLAVRAVTSEDVTPAKRDLALVFNGLCSEFFPVSEWTAGFRPEQVDSFTLEYHGLNPRATNEIGLSSVPDEALCRRARLIVLVDFPLERRVLSYRTQESLLDAVRDGALMIVTGGLAGLEKCGDFDAPIARALPVKLTSPWTLPKGGNKVVCNYGKGRIAVLNRRKANAKDETQK